MRYLLTILIVGALSCKKSADNARQEQDVDPTAKYVSCKTIYSSPSVPNVHWSVDLKVPDTNQVAKLYLKRINPAIVAFEINKPKTKAYTVIQPGVAAPNGSPQAYFYFEWIMSDGSKKQEASFEAREQ